MKGESMDALRLARLICEHAEDVHDDIDMGTVTAETIRQAKIVRDYAICIVDKLQEVER